MAHSTETEQLLAARFAHIERLIDLCREKGVGELHDGDISIRLGAPVPEPDDEEEEEEKPERDYTFAHTPIRPKRRARE